MKKLRLFLAVVVLATLSFTNVHARAVGDRFAGYVVNNGVGTNTLDKVTYVVTSILSSTGEDSLTVAILETTMTGAVTFPGVTADSTKTLFKVTSATLTSDRKGLYYMSSTIKDAITSITFSENFEILNGAAVQDFKNLTTLNLPASLRTITSGPMQCPALKTVTVNSTNPYLKAVNNVIYSKDGTVLYFYPMGLTATSFSVPSGVTTIITGAIESNNVTSISLPASVVDVRQTAIRCGNLTSISVNASNPRYSSPNGLLCSQNGDTLFAVPRAKYSGVVTIPAHVKHVAQNAFYMCKNITQINTNQVESMYFPTYSTSGLKTVVIYPSLKSYVPGQYGTRITTYAFYSTSDYFSIDGSGVLYNKDYTRLVAGPQMTGKSYTTHANTEVVGSDAFYYTGLNAITLSAKVKVIESLAFREQALTSATLNSQLTKIGSYAFYTAQLTTINIPASVDTILASAFSACTALKTAQIGSGSALSYLGASAFDGCSALTTFRFLGSHVAPSLHIGERAFANCSNLASANGGTFSIPKAVNHIGESAFNGCSSLKQAAFHPESALDTIGFAAFQNCGLTSIDIPKTVKYIGNEAFNSCQQLKTVKIPAITNYVGPQAFLFCGQLREILVDEANTNYSSVDGMLASKDKKTLLSFPAGKAATYYTMLSPSFETINDSAFYYNRQLRSVTLPKKVTRIGAHAFALCDKLERINFLADSPISDVHAEAFVDMEKKSLLKNINLYVRNGHKTAFESSSFWGTGKSKSINEAFLVMDDNGSVEYFPMSSTDASIVDVQSDVKTFVVPEKVPGQPAYSVKLIGDYAFENSATSIDEVVVPSGVQLNYVGANAFVKTTNATLFPPIKNVFMVNGTPAELATDKFGIGAAYNEIPNDAHIYVKKSALADYQTAWATMADRIDYKIPGISISKTYGTFAREFDVDLSDYSQDAANNGKGKVWAFVAGDGVLKEGTGSGSVEGEYYIRMHSINEGQEGDGTYIPAGTGVLLKAADGTPATPANYHYVIGEKDVNAAVSGSDVLMKGVTVNDKYLSDTNRNLYAMQGGLFRPFAGATNVKIPVHKAYLELPVRAAGAKVMFYFGNNPVPTAIEGLGLEEGGARSEDAPVYDLQGRRVSGNAALKAGIYVKNGKKFVIK